MHVRLYKKLVGLQVDLHRNLHAWNAFLRKFLPRDATQDCPSVCPSVTLRYDFHTGWNLEYFENNFTAE